MDGVLLARWPVQVSSNRMEYVRGCAIDREVVSTLRLGVAQHDVGYIIGSPHSSNMARAPEV
jgi:outer membrane protein assembly factor BamE (lipoprotein component of BamABCDE complex)